jgi:hypothetical protein
MDKGLDDAESDDMQVISGSPLPGTTPSWPVRAGHRANDPAGLEADDDPDDPFNQDLLTTSPQHSFIEDKREDTEFWEYDHAHQDYVLWKGDYTTPYPRKSSMY